MRPVINTEKHIIQVSLSTIAAGAVTNFVFGTAVAVPTSALGDLREGCKISAIYLEMWIQTDDATLGSSIVTVEKVSGAVTTLMTAAESAALGSYDNKKNIFYTQMGLTPNNVSYPMASVRGWFKIPKSKQRFGLGDRIVVNIHAQSNGLNVCGFGTYKEQF